MSTKNNKPIDTLRDRELKATIWKNFGSKGTFFTVELSITYTDDQGEYQTSHSFSQDQLLRIGRLADMAYTVIAQRYSQLTTTDQEAA